MDMNIKNGKLKLIKNNIKNGGIYLLITVVVVVTIFVTVAEVRSTTTNALPVVLCKITSALVAVRYYIAVSVNYCADYWSN